MVSFSFQLFKLCRATAVKMSLARAFTTRRAKVFGGGGDGEGRPTRSATVKGSIGGSKKISGPVELVHTTNMLSYNAPDIRKGPKISGPVQLIHTTNMLSYDAPDIHKEPRTATSNSSMSFDGDSDHIATAASSPPTSPDTAFPHDIEEDEGKKAIEPNHLSCYFTLPQSSTTDVPDVPSIPKRAPSHSTRKYDILGRKTSVPEGLGKKPSISERLGRKQSLSRLSEQSEQSSRSISSKTSGTFSRASSSSTSTTASSHHSFGAPQMPKTSAMSPPPVPAGLSQSVSALHHKDPPPANPFGQELAQVTELAEEYAATAVQKSLAMATEEEKDLTARGLHKFSAEDYLAEVQSLFATFFATETRHAKSSVPQWI